MRTSKLAKHMVAVKQAAVDPEGSVWSQADFVENCIGGHLTGSVAQVCF